MKIVSGIIMLIGLFFGGVSFIFANSAPQQAVALVPIVGCYVAGRMLENFSETK